MLTHLKLQGFKSFKDAELTLGPLTVLIGPNASGKSNIRDAFRFLHGIGLGYSIADIFGEIYKGGKLQWEGIRGGVREAAFQNSDNFVLEVTSLIKPKDIEVEVDYLLKVMISDSQPMMVQEEFSANPAFQYESNSLKSSALLPIVDHLAHISGKYIEAIEADEFYSELSGIRFFDFDPNVMRQPSFPGQNTLGDRGENLSSVLQKISEKPALKNAITSWIQSLTPLDAQDLEFKSDLTGKVLVYLVEKSGQRTSAYSASDGTLRFLGMIAALLDSESPKICFFEEPENGIHPNRLYLLLELIEKRVKDSNIQVIITTHSPQLLSYLSKESLENASLVYRLENKPDSRIKRIMDFPHIREILEKQDISRLHASSWFEDQIAFAQDEEDIEPFILEEEVVS